MTYQTSRGQATISLVLMIGGIASAIVIAIALVAISAIGTGFGADAQQRARAAAYAGIEDGALHLARNASDSGSYSVSPGSVSTTVTIYANTPSSGYAAIAAQAISGLRRARLYAVYSIDPVTSSTTQISLDTQ